MVGNEPRKRVLLILDMVDVYIYGDKPLIPVENRERMIRNIKKAIDLARQSGTPIIYINSAFTDSDPIYKNYINYRDQAMKGSRESETINELKPATGDFVIHKRGYDGFWKSGLEELLKKLHVQDVYLTGCQTDCCVRETAVTAAHLGYDVYALKDCCETSREFGQVAALRFMRTCTRAIVTTDEIAWNK